MKFLAVLYSVLMTSFAIAQKGTDDIISFQKALNKDYLDSIHSPLKKEDRLAFKGHTFYPVNLTYKVTANLVLTPDEKPFKMATTRGEARDYVKYGEIQFMISGKKYKLNVYQSLDLKKIELYKDFLFLPFKDLTNGVETYGGGRFIDLYIPKGKTIVIDFNKAYNPYCAYNDLFSCPVTPVENTLNIRIPAGVKGPLEH